MVVKWADEERTSLPINELLDALDSFADGVAVWDADDRLVFCNDAFKRLDEEVAALCVAGIRHGDFLRACHSRRVFVECLGASAEDFVATRDAAHRLPGPPIETRLADGRWVRITEVRTRAGGTASCYADITDPKQREAALAERERSARAGQDRSEDVVAAAPEAFAAHRTVLNVKVPDGLRIEERLDMLSQAIEQSPAIVVITDKDGRIEYVNSTFTQITGWSADEAIGRTPAMFVPPNVKRVLNEEIWHTLHAGGVWRGEFRCLKKDGANYWEHASISAIHGDDGEISHYLAVKADLTELKEAEAALRDSERRLAFVIRNVPEAIFMTNGNEIVDLVNPAAERMFGLPANEIVGRPFAALVEGMSPDDVLATSAEIAPQEGQGLRSEIVGIRSDGTRFPLEMAVSQGRRVGGEHSTIKIIRDVTMRNQREAERQAIEKELQQARKMEALGQLAGGMAHEFNNMLVPIMALTELAMADLSSDSRTRSNLELALQAAQRARRLVGQILSFSRDAEPTERIIVLCPVLCDAAEMLRASLPSWIAIDFRATDAGSEVATVLADPMEVHQMVMNLGSNAAAAIGRRSGRLSIMLATATEADLQRFPGRRTGAGHVKLVFADDGCGMDETTRARAFDPFFTTKDVGDGTGMGLAVVHGIVERCGGAIAIDSRPGAGAAFTILLPTCPASEAGENGAAS